MTDDSPARRDLADPEWPVRESRTEYETGWYDGGYDAVEQPDGSTKRYYWAALPPAVVIVAVDGSDLVFVEQYRPPIRERHLELPAGIVEDGESFVEAGARELREEAGLDPAETRLLEEFWVATGVLRHRRGIVYATDCERVDADLDSNEFLTVRRVPVEEAVAVARRQPTNDATVEGVLLARAEGLL